MKRQRPGDCENLSAPVWLDAPLCRGRKIRVVTCEIPASGAVARGVGVFGEVLHEREKCRRLPDEQSHVGEKLDHALGDAFGFGWANDGARRQLAADERTWLRHDQVGLKILATKRRSIQG